MLAKLLRLTKEPLLQFLFIGACIYGAYGLYGDPQEDLADTTIVVDEARIRSFIGQWQARWNRPPTRQELDGLIAAFVRENILYRQALAMGLDEDDPVTRRRMAQKLEYLTSDIALLKKPAEGELERYFQDHEARYRRPDQITFVHVFLDPDKRDESTLGDAAALLEQLQSAGEPDATTLEAGDRLRLQDSFREATELEVRRELGSGFAEALMKLEPGRWHGPVLSGYGVHLVYVYELRQAPPPAFAEVEENVLADWQKAQQDQFNREFYANLERRYEVVIAQPPADTLLQVPGKPDADRAPEAKPGADTTGATEAPPVKQAS